MTTKGASAVFSSAGLLTTTTAAAPKASTHHPQQQPQQQAQLHNQLKKVKAAGKAKANGHSHM